MTGLFEVMYMDVKTRASRMESFRVIASNGEEAIRKADKLKSVKAYRVESVTCLGISDEQPVVNLTRQKIEGWKMNNGSMSPNEFRDLCDLAINGLRGPKGEGLLIPWKLIYKLDKVCMQNCPHSNLAAEAGDELTDVMAAYGEPSPHATGIPQEKS